MEEEKFSDSVPTSVMAIQVSEFGEPSVLKYVETKAPTPGAGEVLVSMRAAGVNPVETYIRSGKYAKLPNLPFTPGAEGAGFVQAVGEGVTKLKVGQRVYLAGSKTGTYAQYSLCAENTVFPLPDNVSFKQGACIGTATATAYRALFRAAKIQEGDKVLVHGASGGVGIAAVQLAKAKGCFVIGSASSEEGREICTQAGCDEVVDHSKETHLDEVKELTGGSGVDVVVEMLANVNLGKDLPALAYGGRVAIVGSRGNVEINPRDLMQKEAYVIGVMNAFQHTNAAEAVAMHAHIFEALKAGQLKPIVHSQSFPLSSAADAHIHVEKGEAAQGKVVMVITHAA